jgi:hypothetical protein
LAQEVLVEAELDLTTRPAVESQQFNAVQHTLRELEVELKDLIILLLMFLAAQLIHQHLVVVEELVVLVVVVKAATLAEVVVALAVTQVLAAEVMLEIHIIRAMAQAAAVVEDQARTHIHRP